jgi:hypothetical protein
MIEPTIAVSQLTQSDTDTQMTKRSSQSVEPPRERSHYTRPEFISVCAWSRPGLAHTPHETAPERFSDWCGWVPCQR